MRDEGVEEVERFSAGGRGAGFLGLVGVAAFLAYGVLDPAADFAPWLWPLTLLVGVALWVVLVRPAVLVRGRVLELRNMLHTDLIPLARVTDVRISQVTVVRADERRFVGSGMGSSRRQLGRDEQRGHAALAADRPFGWLVEEKLNRLAEAAREVTAEEPPPVRRTWAWPEIAGLVVLGGAVLVLALR
ncbi:hypothetical protein [Nocardioides sp. SYSU DS0651]|uniref:hypothetical protein n=1 Tax=Nocardioides sp. SYSU DS0651 TaxID=3415955 RepID=UPI003F4BCA9A